jgi:hypothetical protein
LDNACLAGIKPVVSLSKVTTLSDSSGS